jgi:predicted amidohydrolase YtcJ
MTRRLARGKASIGAAGAPRRIAALVLALCLAAWAPRVSHAEGTQAPSGPLTVYRAAKIITMEPALPEARVVAVRDGAIVAVGRDLEDLAAWTEANPFEIDDTLADKILLPGFIDPHLHPMLGALLLPMEFITPDDWSLPRGAQAGVRDRATYMKRLRELVDGWPDASQPLFTWGYHELWHGKLRRADLDAVSDRLPIVVFQRSFHEQVLNTPALALAGIDPDSGPPHGLPAGVDPAHFRPDEGYFFETATSVVLARLAPIVFAPERVVRGLEMTRALVHRGGITTIADMALGLTGDMDAEAQLMQRVFERGDAPFRLLLVPAVKSLAARGLEGDELVAAAEDLAARHASHRIRIGRHVKLLADGAFFSRLMQMNPPGYPDGRHGAWLTEPEDLLAQARPFWNAGYDVHVHVNGDRGLDVVLDMLATLLSEKPRFDHRLSLEHMGFSTEDQTRRIAALGAVVSAQPYYLYVLGDAYAERGLGYERASQISRLASLVARGIPLTLHSDLTMAPAQPLRLAWVAANRLTMDGTLMAPAQRLTVDQALRAVTSDAAFVLRMEDRIGSIRAGKSADFTVLERDPYEVGAAGLAEIPVWGTVFEGRPYPVAR